MDLPDQIYKSQEGKFRAVVGEIAELHKKGQPVLVGTVSVETSEMLSEWLRRKGVPHNVLNAKQHEKEAGVIAQAGRSGTVTIATNMAGRGVDILLGGNADGMARERLRHDGVDLAVLPKDDPLWLGALEKARSEVEVDRQKVLAAGGLHVLGTERHEARRIDNQLRGRAGRQGDPGSSRFFISLEDDLMRRFGGQNVAGLMDKLGLEEDMPIEHNLINKAIENAQVRVEGYNFDIRKHVLEYDDVVNKQREVIYNQRLQILTEPTMRPTIQGMIEDEIRATVNGMLADPSLGQGRTLEQKDWDLTAIAVEMSKIFPLPKGEDIEHWRSMNADQLADYLVELAVKAYDEKEASVGAENMRQLERLVMLRDVDSRWVRHLTDLDELREGIGLRAFAQVDPLIAYKKEAHEMYQELLASISQDIVHTIYHAQLMVMPAAIPVQRMQTNRGDGGGQPQPVRSAKQIGRNDPCWCGSGKKYKQCHMRSDQGLEPAPAGSADGAQAAARAAARAASKPQPAAAVIGGGNKKASKGKPSHRH